MQASATACSSSRPSTLPVGLCGVLMRIARTRRPPSIAARNASGSSRKSGGRSVTNRQPAPAKAMHAV